MGREWTIKSFKSGNSVALRVPASAGVVAGEEWRMVECADGYKIERVARPKRKFNIAKVWGSAKSLQPIDENDRWFEERPSMGALDQDGDARS